MPTFPRGSSQRNMTTSWKPAVCWSPTLHAGGRSSRPDLMPFGHGARPISWRRLSRQRGTRWERQIIFSLMRLQDDLHGLELACFRLTFDAITRFNKAGVANKRTRIGA